MLLLLLACDDALPPIPDDLTVSQRAARIRALQDGSTDAGEEEAIRDLLLGARGEELLALKQDLDHGSSANLHHLVFSDVDDDSLRTEIVAHLQVAAGKLRRLQVLSDIDDTLYANWIDTRFPSGTVYPGVLDLYAALTPDGPPTFISARPGDRAGVVEEVTLASLADLGVADPTLLAGDFSHLTSHEAMAEKKHRNFVEYSILYPEYDFVFLGDSGQGDAELGRRMLASHPERVRGVFINDVTDAEEGKLPVPPEERAAAAATGLHYVDTWLDAARIARQRDLIDDTALARLAVRSAAALEAVPFEEPSVRAERLREHTAASAAAAAALSPEVPEQPEALAKNLEERCQRDQVLRMAGEQEDIEITGLLDTAFISALVAAHGGFPTAEVLGSPGAVQCAWLLVQHAEDLALQRAALATLTESPPEGIEFSRVALLADRVALRSGQPQTFGTQLRQDGGVYRLLPVADPEGLDARREVAGLPPLAEYAAQVAGDAPVDLTPLEAIPADISGDPAVR